MQRRFRLTRSEDFRQVRQSGRSYAHPLAVLIARKNDGQQSRVGIAAGRLVGTAVKRNRAKRLLRTAMQSLMPSVAAGWDIVLVARPALVAADLTDLRSALDTLLRRARLLPGS